MNQGQVRYAVVGLGHIAQAILHVKIMKRSDL